MAKTRDELTFCGINCEECSIYRANVFGEELSPETVKRWQEDFKKYLGIESVKPEQLNCRGCRNKGEELFYAFKQCPIRKCCIKRGLSSCGLCSDFKTCEINDISEGKANLVRIAATE